MPAPPAGAALVASAADLGDAVRRVAAEIDVDHPDGLVAVGLLPDSIVFLADLVRCLRVPAAIDFVAVAPYDGDAGRARIVKDLDHPVAGRAVVVVTTVVDTGLTLDFVRRHLEALEPASVRIAALAVRPGRGIVPAPVDYGGVVLGPAHVVGYGLDHESGFRNLPDLWAYDPPRDGTGRLAR